MLSPMFELLVAIVGAVAGGVASVVGFGIGSLLTPLLALRVGTKVGVTLVALPHVFGTALRFWRLRDRVDKQLLKSFGVMSAVGGLAGALLHAYAASHALQLVFGGLLVFAGGSQLTGLAKRMRFGRIGKWVAGALSGIFGGLVGNQGGIRSAAMLGFDVKRDAFVATATAVALLVDAGRVPVYLATDWRSIATYATLVAIATAGVLAGTVIGTRLLTRIPEAWFRRMVAVIVLALGVYMLLKPAGG